MAQIRHLRGLKGGRCGSSGRDAPHKFQKQGIFVNGWEKWS